MTPAARAAACAAPPAPARPLLRRCSCGGKASGAGECAECRNKRLQRSPSAGASSADTAPPAVHDVLRSPGQRLDGATRGYMEPRFGHSFASVRVHADERAAESAASVGARAYAVGHDVVFGRGMYSPGSADGKRLIAHELAHVVQQSGTAPDAISPSLEIGPVDAPEERQADAAADAVMGGEAAGGLSAGMEGQPVVRRQTAPTARQLRRSDQLQEMATWPEEALRAWQGLSEGERTIVTFSMLGRYGEDFARAFLAIASNPRARRRVPVLHSTNMPEDDPPHLLARGYRRVGLWGGNDWWVRPNGDVVQRVLPSGGSGTGQTAPTQGQQQQTPPPPPPQQAQPPEPAEPPARLPARSTWGPETRRHDGATVMGSGDRAVQYQDGTIELRQANGQTYTYRPHPQSTGSYDFYDENGNLTENVIIVLDPDEVFGTGAP